VSRRGIRYLNQFLLQKTYPLVVLVGTDFREARIDQARALRIIANYLIEKSYRLRTFTRYRILQFSIIPKSCFSLVSVDIENLRASSRGGRLGWLVSIGINRLKLRQLYLPLSCPSVIVSLLVDHACQTSDLFLRRFKPNI
jgi:hypothetical protein